MTYKVPVREHVRGGAPVNQHERMPKGAKVGGDFIAPNASPEAKRAILQGRILLYANKGEALKHAILAGHRLTDGAPPIIAMIMAAIEKKAGPLADQDAKAVAVHLAGTIVEYARDHGDPDTNDGGSNAVQEITVKALQLFAQSRGGQDQGSAPAMAPPPGGPPMPQQGQAPLLASGMQNA